MTAALTTKQHTGSDRGSSTIFDLSMSSRSESMRSLKKRIAVMPLKSLSRGISAHGHILIGKNCLVLAPTKGAMSAEFVRTYNAQAHEITNAITAEVINAHAGAKANVT
jgi:hypothetical protein